MLSLLFKACEERLDIRFSSARKGPAFVRPARRATAARRLRARDDNRVFVGQGGLRAVSQRDRWELGEPQISNRAGV